AADRAADRSPGPAGRSRAGFHSTLTFDEMVEKGYVVIGSPTSVAEQLTEVAISLNVGNLMLLLQFGNMDRDLTMFNTELFADKVMPEIHGLFEDQWEHRWWPDPLPTVDRRRTGRPPGVR
ncbi:MAG TPA: hypothetical protein DDZ64_01965, partial [Acidimicrobiaceae bacterium]|nr:hypothetical protein [Acidimicrobiaceae bacterium]